VSPGFEYSHGVVYDFETGQMTSYFDYNFPPDIDVVGATILPSIEVRASNHGQGVKWTIAEALALMVAEGSASGTTYAFTQDSGVTEVDVIVPSIVADIRAKLVEMVEDEHVPPYFNGWLDAAGVTVADIVAMYQQAIDFIDVHGHAYIGDGGYYIDAVDSANSQMTLKANRDPSYPYTGEDILDMFVVTSARVDEVAVPLAAATGQDIDITIMASQAEYPYDIFEPATELAVQLVFVGDQEYTYTATMVQPGQFEVVIPAADTAGLAAGPYTIVAIAAPASGPGLPNAVGNTLLLQ
jgi:peptide/nickel transport system substrate-binding protein